MGAYRYEAKKETGEIIESIIYASSQEEAMEKIKDMGYLPVKIGDMLSPDSVSEKRIYVRLDNRVYVRYKMFKLKTKSADDIDYEPEVAVITKNMSAGGLLLRTSESLALGTIIDLSLELPEENPVQCLARVVRIEEIVLDRDYEIAVCFLDLPNLERARLNRYVLRCE